MGCESTFDERLANPWPRALGNGQSRQHRVTFIWNHPCAPRTSKSAGPSTRVRDRPDRKVPFEESSKSHQSVGPQPLDHHFPRNCNHVARDGAGYLEVIVLGPSPGTGESFQFAARRFLDEVQINTWRHPFLPIALVEKSVHFSNLLLAHFHYAARGLVPLTLNWTEENNRELVSHDTTIVESMQTLQRYATNLSTCFRIHSL